MASQLLFIIQLQYNQFFIHLTYFFKKKRRIKWGKRKICLYDLHIQKNKQQKNCIEKKYLKIHKICDNKKKEQPVFGLMFVAYFFSHNKMNRMLKKN